MLLGGVPLVSEGCSSVLTIIISWFFKVKHGSNTQKITTHCINNIYFSIWLYTSPMSPNVYFLAYSTKLQLFNLKRISLPDITFGKRLSRGLKARGLQSSIRLGIFRPTTNTKAINITFHLPRSTKPKSQMKPHPTQARHKNLILFPLPLKSNSPGSIPFSLHPLPIIHTYIQHQVPVYDCPGNSNEHTT